MPFLALNGIEIDALNDTFTETPREIGSTEPAFDGTLRRTRIARKRDVRFDTPWMLQSEARAWEGLIVGEGHSWSFDSHLYSSKGLGPNAGYAASQVTAAAKYGTGYLSVNATTGTITYAASLGSNWTIAYWMQVGGNWFHYVRTSAGDKWENGVQNNGLALKGTVTSGSLVITNTDGSAALFDDVVALPFVVPSAWVASLYAATVAFSSLPKLDMTGDCLSETTTRSVLGSVESSVLGKGYLSGSFRTNMRKLTVQLSEV
jgi:hypothetical protein